MRPTFTQRRQKKSTVLVSKQSVEDALTVGQMLSETWFEENQNDPRIDQLQNIMDQMHSVLSKGPQEIKAEGVSTIEDYFDDTQRPNEAQTIKRGVDMIAKWRRIQRAKKTNSVPVAASKKANGFITDRDEKGEPKAPEKASVPRLAAKKEAAPAAAVAPAPAAPVAPAPSAIPAAVEGKADIKALSSEALAAMVQALAKLKEFERDKAAQAFIELAAEELKGRPVEPEEQKAPKAPLAMPAPAPAAPAMPMAASIKTSAPINTEPNKAKIPLGGLTVAAEEEDDEEPVGKEASAANGSWSSQNEDTGSVVESGGRTPEIEEAHSKRDDNTGISLPSTTAPIKLAADMATSRAVKEAEKMGDELKRMYLAAKPLTNVNDSRPVREAVEAIYRAANLFDEAGKTLNKQQVQETEEEEASKKSKKSSIFGGLTFAAAE